MSNVWFISDTHWGHKNIIQYSNRPFASVEDMNEKLIENWNSLVKAGDIVWHLGDFSFQSYKDFVPTLLRLNGTINVVLGNHDQVIEKHSQDLRRIKLNSIQNYAEIKVPGAPMIVMFHYGQRVWNKSHHGSIHLYGHSHGSLPPFGKSVDVGVDCKEITHEYRPIHLDEVVAYMSKRQGEVVDHHDGRRD
jgi:Predicted phosphoesterase or phosphohydrolase